MDPVARTANNDTCANAAPKCKAYENMPKGMQLGVEAENGLHLLTSKPIQQPAAKGQAKKHNGDSEETPRSIFPLFTCGVELLKEAPDRERQPRKNKYVRQNRIEDRNECRADYSANEKRVREQKTAQAVVPLFFRSKHKAAKHAQQTYRQLVQDLARDAQRPVKVHGSNSNDK